MTTFESSKFSVCISMILLNVVIIELPYLWLSWSKRCKSKANATAEFPQFDFCCVSWFVWLNMAPDRVYGCNKIQAMNTLESPYLKFTSQTLLKLRSFKSLKCFPSEKLFLFRNFFRFRNSFWLWFWKACLQLHRSKIEPEIKRERWKHRNPKHKILLVVLNFVACVTNRHLYIFKCNFYKTAWKQLSMAVILIGALNGFKRA